MASFSGLIFHSSGIQIPAIGIGYYPKMPFKKRNCSSNVLSKFHSETELISERIHNIHSRCFLRRGSGKTHILAAGRDHQMSYNDDTSMEPFWVNPIREAIRATQTLFAFLVEQPSQLRYIEWPSFQSTLKTATLTLVLVALLIVALASVDSTLSYLLALLLRRKA